MRKVISFAVVIICFVLGATCFGGVAFAPAPKAYAENKASAVDALFPECGHQDCTDGKSGALVSDGIIFHPKEQKTISTCAASMAVLETTTKRVLYCKDMHTKRPMASTTKIITAIVTIENTPNLDKIIEVPAAAIGVEGSSIYLGCGEKISIRDLLYGLMLQSGNDAATALAIAVGGSVERFAQMMNDFAKRVGAKNSNFKNPHGLHHAEHYTTAYDLALISAHAMQNPAFRQIVGTKVHKATWDGRDYPRIIVNKNKLLKSYEGCNGVKTGFTKKAGRCFVGSAERGGMEVVCAVLNCGPMFEECGSLMSKAFDEYEMVDVVKPYEKIASIPVKEGRTDKVSICSNAGFRYPLTKAEKETIEIKVTTSGEMVAPVRAKSPAGEVSVYLDNELLFKQKAFTMVSVKQLTFTDKLKRFLEKLSEKKAENQCESINTLRLAASPHAEKANNLSCRAV